MKKIRIKNKKKLYVSLILLFLIIVLIFLFLDFSSVYTNSKNSEVYDSNGEKIKTNNLNEINKYIPEKNINEVVTQPYFNEIERLLRIENYNELYKHIDKNYLTKNGFNEQTLKEYLINNEYIDKFVNITSTRYCNQDYGTCVYRMKCFSSSKKKYYVNVIETKPFEYTIDFSQDEIPTTDEKKYNIYSDDLDYEITELYRASNSIALQVKITNKSDKEIEFYFNSISDLELVLKNGEKVKQATAELSSRKYIIKKNSYFIKKFYFPLDMQYHSSIDGLNFYNVRFEDSKKNIKITF